MFISSNSSNNSGSIPLLSYTDPTFHIVDYVVFAAFLCVSGVVGVFFSFRGKKNTSDYFFGSRQMKAVPVGISTGVSFMSAGSLVGIPAETHINGYSFLFGVVMGSLGYFVGNVSVAYVLRPLGMTSVNEYLTKRFRSRALTYTANIMVLLCIFEYMGMCMLGSVIAFNSVTGGKVSIVLGLAIGAVVGTFYTAVGGLKAVVWTDVIQSGFMFIGIATVIVKSIVDTPGGMSEIIRYNVDYGRIHPLVWSFDPTVRHTMWGLVVGLFIGWGVWCIQPACVQRLCSTRSLRDSCIVAGLAAFLFLAFSVLPFWAGINIFGYYASRGCDVYAAGWIANNEIILYYVRERLAYPGFQGLFIAALYAGSLSSLSSGLNAASAILWKDTIAPMLKDEVPENRATLISKVIVVVFGVLAMIWCYILYSFGGLILQVAASIDASMYGAYFALFVLGVCFRYSNWKGALTGLIVSFVFTFWLGLGSIMHGKSLKPYMPSTTENCAANITRTNYTTQSPAQMAAQEVGQSFLDQLYSVSYVWLSIICISVSLVVSLVVTGCTGSYKERDERLLLPLCRPKRWSCLGCQAMCEENDNSPEDSADRSSEDYEDEKTPINGHV